MSTLPLGRHVAAFVTVLAAVTILAAPCAAGLRDTVANVRDTVACSAGAVLNPLRVVDWGIKNFERLTANEYERLADKSMKTALKECREAAENIYARGFGVEGIVDKLRDNAAAARATVTSVQDAVDKVSRWFGRDARTPNDHRMALSVAARERDFYENETGVLGPMPLPPAPEWKPREEMSDLIDPMQRESGDSTDAWGNETAREPRVDTGSTPPGSRSANESDPWRQDSLTGSGREPTLEQSDGDTWDAAWPKADETRRCEDEREGCPGDEYWNDELQEKARRIDPWAEYREASRRAKFAAQSRDAAGANDRGDDAMQGCEDGWADCTGTGWIEDGTSEDPGGIAGSHTEAGSEGLANPSGTTYRAALAELRGESAEPSEDGSAKSEGSYRAALDRLEEESEERKRRERERSEASRAEGTSSGNTLSASSRSRGAGQGNSETLSSNCAEQTSACTRAVRTAEMQNAPLRMAFQNASSISKKKSILAVTVLNGLAAARTCYSAEKRSHCKSIYLNGIRELERTLQSAQQ